jgi:hypothetical protein
MHFIDVGMASLGTSTHVLVEHMKASSKDTLGALVACFDAARRNRMSGKSEIDNARRCTRATSGISKRAE